MHLVFTDGWTEKVGEKQKKHTREEAIANYQYRRYRLIGHTPIEASSLIYYLLNESTENVIERMGFGKRMQEVGLVAPLEYTVVTTDNMATMILLSELRKNKEKYKH